MTEPIYTEKQCQTCGHVFLRYLDHGNIGPTHMREQKTCPVCECIRTVVEVHKPGEKL